MKRLKFKKWLCAMVVVLGIFLLFGCADLETDMQNSDVISNNTMFDVASNISDSLASDNIKPVITLSKSEFVITVGDSAPNYAEIAKASDNIDGDLTSNISIDSSEVNYNSAGTYEVVYSVSDSNGNVATQNVTVTVNAKSQSISTDSNAQVLITRTGECYHRRKCGNGTYFWVSFSEAQSRGLRACQKCY